MVPIDRTSIDKSLPVPVGLQLHGLLAYAISHGGMPYGARLPSVRDLAHDSGLAPMTVNKVYQGLRDAGLIEIRRGRGAFVARDPRRIVSEKPELAALRRRIDALLAQAAELAIPADELLAMINSQMQVRRLRVGLRLVFVGIFEGPAQDYAEEIRPFLMKEDRIEVTTIEALRGDATLRRRCSEADAVLTFVHRRAEVEKVLPRAKILALRFIPSEATRRALAGLDPRDRIAAVTRFEEYIAIMRPSIRQFAPHVSDILVTTSSAPDLRESLARRDVVIYATGADGVTALLAPGTRHFEYRHSPDPGELSRVLTPFLAELRSRIVDAGAAASPDAGFLRAAASASLAAASKNNRQRPSP